MVRHLRDQQVDALFCPHCNFGTEDVAALLGKEMGLPYLLWGPRDEMPLPDGTRLRDTQCGLFATSRILQQLHVPFTYIPNCRLDDPVFDQGVQAFIQVASVCQAMRNLKIGQLGQRADFFWTVMINEAELLERFNAQVYQIYLGEVISRIRELRQTPTAEMRELEQQMRASVNCDALEQEQVNGIVALQLVLGEVIEREGLSAVAVQCFPDFFRELRISPCYAHSVLTQLGTPVICETDVHGAISAVMLQSAALHATPTYFADLTIRHPENDNAELLWHCGSFPCSLAAEDAQPMVGKHFIMPGDFAGMCHWRVRDGDVTIARFARGEDGYCLAFGEGKGITGPATVGTYQWLQVRDWLQWEKKFIRGPYIHHVACIHGSLSPILQEACRYLPGLSPDPIDKTPAELEDFWWHPTPTTSTGVQLLPYFP
ncbi:MAG TPA: fucose isomerase [Armatimonadota bacterium]